MKVRPMTVIMLFCLLGLPWILDAQPTAILDSDSILEKIAHRIKERENKIQYMTYQANSSVVITNTAGELEKKITSLRTIEFTTPNTVKNHYQTMTVNDRRLTETEMLAEVKKSRKQGGQSPFLSSKLPKYNFTVKGEATYQQLSVWEVTFKPKEAEQGLAVGSAYIDRESYDVVYLTFSPSKIPSVMKSMIGELTYQLIDEYWQPKSFKMTMHLKVAFIFTFADKLIDIQEVYSKYDLSRKDQAATSLSDKTSGN